MSQKQLYNMRVYIFAVLLTGVSLLFSCEEPEPDEETEYTPVETILIQESPFNDWISTTGVIEAVDDALLRAENPGTVVHIASEGDEVAAGDVVMRTDPEQVQAVVEQTRAAVEEAQSSLDQLEDEIERFEPLVRDTLVSQLEFNQLLSQRDQVMATLQQARAAHREAEQAMEQTQLKAPFDGLIDQRWVRTGEQVSVGQEILRIVGAGQLEATAGIPARFSGDIQPGARAVVDLHTYGVGEITSSVSVVGRSIDPANRTFQVRIFLEEPNDQIKTDMIARVRILRQALENALVVPPAAVQRDEIGETLLVAAPVDEDELAVVEQRSVATGARSEDGIVIEEGLQAGEEILIVGILDAVAGDTVRVSRRYESLQDYRQILEQEMDEAQQITPGEPVP